MRPDRPTASRRPGGWQHLLLAALLFGAQLLLAMHGLDHLDVGTGDTCEVCLAGQHLGHAAPTQATLASPLPAEVPRPSAVAAAPIERPAPSPCQRGPPRALRIA